VTSSSLAKVPKLVGMGEQTHLDQQPRDLDGRQRVLQQRHDLREHPGELPSALVRSYTEIAVPSLFNVWALQETGLQTRPDEMVKPRWGTQVLRSPSPS
jgi:hypothetical protein